jgi:hypothetical protein
MKNEFLPEDYNVPAGGGNSNYMKFKDGENKFRIMGSPIIGWVWWVDSEGNVRAKGGKPQKGDKPIRVPKDMPITEDKVSDIGDVKHFWAMPVYNYETESIQILEVTQKSIQNALRTYSKDPDWGSPVLAYDILVKRSGEGLETSYEVLPKPAKPLDEGILQLYKDTHIDLQALFAGGDPFASI